MQSPFLLITTALTGGMLLASLTSLPAYLLIAGAFFSLLGGWLTYLILRKNRLPLILILITFFLCGAFLLTSAEKNYKGNPLYKFESSSYVDFYGNLYKSPIKEKDFVYLYLEVNRIQAFGRNIRARGNLLIRVPLENQNQISLSVHDYLKVSAKPSEMENFRNFGGRSSAVYYKSLNIHLKAFSKSPLLIEKIRSGNNFSLLRVIADFRSGLQKKIESYFQGPEDSLSQTGAILEALVLGNRSRLDTSTSTTLQQSGLFHLFAISGAHIVIISYVLFLFFKIIRIPMRTSYLVLIFVLIFFTFLVEGRPSVLRASLMASLFLLGKIIWKDVNLLNTLSISAFILLVLNPFNLYSLGFQMTFTATLSIILFYSKILKFIPRLPFKISEILAVSLAAQIGVLPLIVIAFNRVTLFSFFLNIAAFPLVAFIMTAGYLFLGAAFVFPQAASLLAAGIDFLINIFILTARIPAHCGFLSYRIPTPHLITALVYYLLLLLLLTPNRIKKQKLLITSAFLISLTVLITYPFSSRSSTLKVTFLDVGQGDAILVEYPGKVKMLIDGGGILNSDFDIGEQVVSPVLWNKGIKKIDYLVLTHAHPDHFYGLRAVVKNFKIKEFWEAYSPQDNQIYQDFKFGFTAFTIHRRVYKGVQENINDVSVEILHPEKDDFIVQSAHNRQSVVIRIVYRSKSFLLTGDIESNGEEKLTNSDQILRSQILKSPHHGSRSSSSRLFLEAVSPDIAVITVGRNNVYHLPHQEILDRYEQFKVRVYRTDVHGAVELETDGEVLKIRTAVSNLNH